MIRSSIFLLFIFNVFDPFTCVERSDWTYDRETRIVTRTIANGTTYSCLSRDITTPIMNKELDSKNETCLPGTGSENDTSCVRMEFVRIFTHAMQSNRTCVVPPPKPEEIFERIEKMYRSSLVNNPIPKEWFVRFSTNMTKLKCGDDGIKKLSKSAEEELKSAAILVLKTVHEELVELPKLWKEVSALASVLEEAKLREEEAKNIQSVLLKTEEDLREQLLALEFQALSESYEFELSSWLTVAQLRNRFVKIFIDRTEWERTMACNTQTVFQKRLAMLSKMAQANEKVALIETLVREVDYHMERAQSVDEEDVETEK